MEMAKTASYVYSYDVFNIQGSSQISMVSIGNMSQ